MSDAKPVTFINFTKHADDCPRARNVRRASCSCGLDERSAREANVRRVAPKVQP